MIVDFTRAPAAIELAAERVLKIPGKHLGRDESGLDCAGMVRWVYGHQAIDVPLPDSYPLQWFRRDPGRMQRWVVDVLQWPRVHRVRGGDLLLMRLFTRGGDHPGVYLGGGRFLHGLAGQFTIEHLHQSFGRDAWVNRIAAAYRPRELECPSQSPSSLAPPSAHSPPSPPLGSSPPT